MKNKIKKLNGQLWEPCPRCGEEPVYLSLGGYCEKCGDNGNHKNTNEIYGDEYE